MQDPYAKGQVLQNGVEIGREAVGSFAPWVTNLVDFVRPL